MGREISPIVPNLINKSMTKTKERGYFSLETEEGVKWAHFSRTFFGQLKEIYGEDLSSLGEKLRQENKNLDDQFNLMCLIFHSGLNAYALENDIDEKYNEHKVANWLWDAMNKDQSVITNMMESLMSGLPKPQEGKVQGK